MGRMVFPDSPETISYQYSRGKIPSSKPFFPNGSRSSGPSQRFIVQHHPLAHRRIRQQAESRCHIVPHMMNL